jgi:hypothetical protein
MKRRKGFVTNSSSTSYLFYIPTNLDMKEFVELNKEKIENWLSNSLGIDGIKDEFPMDDVIYDLKQLQLGEDIEFKILGDEIDYTCDILNILEFKIHTFYGSGGNGSSYTLLNDPDLKRKILKAFESDK